jgi:hypothetical protein
MWEISNSQAPIFKQAPMINLQTPNVQPRRHRKDATNIGSARGFDWNLFIEICLVLGAWFLIIPSSRPIASGQLPVS